MSKHTWEIEEVDSGAAGINNFWKCKVCGASAGFAAGELWPQATPFYANGSGLRLTFDCAESKRLIAAFEVGAWWGRHKDKQQRIKTGNRRVRPEVELSDD